MTSLIIFVAVYAIAACLLHLGHRIAEQERRRRERERLSRWSR